MKIIFLDRDGVINRDPGGWTEHSYVTRWAEFKFLPGAKDALKRLTGSGYEIMVISNQAGVNKGYFTLTDLNAINERMLKELLSCGCRIRSTHYCPHRADEDCGCRKPKTGLFTEAAKGMEVDFGRTFFIGDGSMDIEAGRRIGCRTILLLSGKTKLEDLKDWKYRPDYIKKDLSEAADWILKGA